METQPKPWWKSYKLIAAVVGLVLIFVNAAINHTTIDPNSVTQGVMLIIGAYMASKAWEDGEQAKARATVTAANMTAASQASTTTVTTPSENVTVSTSDGTSTPPVGLTGLH